MDSSNRYFGNCFDYIPETKQFVTDASLLQHVAKGPMFSQVYANRPEVGLVIYSGDPDQHDLHFVVKEVNKNSDGDITHWVLEPVFARDKEYSVIVWNT